MSAEVADSPFHVPAILDILGGLVQRCRDFWLGLGRIETSVLGDQLDPVPLMMPIYVCGLARAGTTLLHEAIASHAGVATHRVKDFPMVFTPYWWRRASAKMRASTPRERAHRDRVMITTESPEALEEMLWHAFFPRCHDPAEDNRIGRGERRPRFEAFYKAHLRKLLLAEGASRYVAKANYHVARLLYLQRLFPDARFVLPVRAPAAHIASLMRQHAWFSRGQRRQPRALAYFRRSGHFEFGLDRRPINLGDHEAIQRIRRDWSIGAEVRGWARYWAMIYGHLANLLATDSELCAATLVVRFEDLCAKPEPTLRAVFAHTRLHVADAIIDRLAPSIGKPAYYANPLTPADLEQIEEETSRVAPLWGYC